MADRKQTEPGGWQSPAGPVDPDDIPTRPDAADPNTLALARVYGDLSAAERERAVIVLRYWARCTNDQRVLVEHFAKELAICAELRR